MHRCCGSRSILSTMAKSIRWPRALSPPTARPCTCTCKIAAPSGAVWHSQALAYWGPGSLVPWLFHQRKTFRGVRAAFKQLSVALAVGAIRVGVSPVPAPPLTSCVALHRPPNLRPAWVGAEGQRCESDGAVDGLPWRHMHQKSRVSFQEGHNLLSLWAHLGAPLVRRPWVRTPSAVTSDTKGRSPGEGL